MQMLAKPESICYATDERPQGVELQDAAEKMPGMCDCASEEVSRPFGGLLRGFCMRNQ